MRTIYTPRPTALCVLVAYMLACCAVFVALEQKRINLKVW